MKKFLLYVFLAFAIVAAVLAYILYSEGAFETYEPTKQSDLEPFMKCEAGKCAPGKCGMNN
jgi:succinate dehydrogenase/fumarate reductase cytochrome b subunit